jgi:hypothetical protein
LTPLNATKKDSSNNMNLHENFVIKILVMGFIPKKQVDMLNYCVPIMLKNREAQFLSSVHPFPFCGSFNCVS